MRLFSKSLRTCAQWMLVVVDLLLLLLEMTSAEKILGVETDEFDFDGLPGAQHEFKIEIPAGKEECFYQKIVAGGKLHVSFEVLRGGNHQAVLYLLSQDPASGAFHILQKTEEVPRGGFQYGPFEETRNDPLKVLRGGDQLMDYYIRRPSLHSPVYESRAQPRWIVEVDPEEEGAYAICLDNSMSMMASKLVYVYLVTYVEEEWTKYREEIEELHITVGNFSETIKNVQESIQGALVHQAQGRMNVIKDWYLITGNNQYIQRWSIALCVVVVLSSCVQVFFVRRLFRYTNVTSTKKPRA